MGYPIYTNIFSDNPKDSAELRRFPIQVAVLYSPGDKIFINAFREVFLELDQITGDELVFFAVLDPPDDWLEVAKNRTSWKEYWGNREVGHSINDRMLIDEIALRFGVKWSDLPAIVVSTNLWNAEFVTSPTTPDHIIDQLQSLTKLAKKSGDTGDLDVGHIHENLQDKFGFPVQYHAPDEGLRRGFSRFYEILNLDRQIERNQERRIAQYWNDTFWTTVRSVRSAISSISEPLQNIDLRFSAGIDLLLRQLTGQLIPFVAYFEKKRERRLGTILRDRFDLPEAEIFITNVQDRDGVTAYLDDESLTMINTALRTGAFLDNQEPLKRLLQNYRNTPQLEEFSPAGQGLWKAFEREINLSVVQAIRNARTIAMPQFFARYQPRFTGNSKIKTPKPIDVNRLDWEDSTNTRHRFIEIGVALKCVNELSGNPNEQFDRTINRCLGTSSLPEELLNDWHDIVSLRNPSSHTELLSRTGFKEVAKKVLKPKTLQTLMDIKRTLLQ